MAVSTTRLGRREKELRVANPAGNPAHLVRSEVSDIYKAMGKIRMLEKKLK